MHFIWIPPNLSFFFFYNVVTITIHNEIDANSLVAGLTSILLRCAHLSLLRYLIVTTVAAVK